MKTLVLITARGGSKGIPGKNIKKLNGKPLICYSIDTARTVADDADICVSTDDPEIIRVTEDYGLGVPFIRPAELATDNIGSYEVIVHALDFYRDQRHISYETVILLQPTSPFRTPRHIHEANQLFSPDTDMVMSVVESKANPYFNLYEEDTNGNLIRSKISNVHRRQDSPIVYQANGSIYIMNVHSLRKEKFNQFTKVKKYVMSEIDSLDIDTLLDWEIAEYIGTKYYK